MNNLVELSRDEQLNINGGYFFGPIILDLVRFYNDVKAGFDNGMRDSIK